MGTIQETAIPKNDDASNSINNEINSNPVGSDSVNNNETALQSVSNEGGGDSETNNNPPLSTNRVNSDNTDTNIKHSVIQKNVVPVPAISRIARPCLGHQKAAVPVTPTQNICDGAVKGLLEDFGRQKLRVGSMDTIWETHPHRLNEAGLIRHSDNSVLTEDTDSFIIGDRVWVGGTKPGQIAYIGETQFAPGEWAGIVLDIPIGKNDGSVGGIRYFQCEARRGVFSRLTRLTRAPLPGADESFTHTSHIHNISSTPLNNGTKPRVASPLSPTGSTKNLRKSPSLSTSNTSLASTTHIVDFKVGDRVIIKSSQGSKVGTLRYMGTTSFASGEWCGVELDEPRGKNDGSVEGIRYFECKPQFGLFAPVTKVSKSPLKYKPGNCVLHSGAKLPPSGMKRTGSKESMTSFTSMTSSLASTTSGARRVRLGVNSLTPQKVTTKPTATNFPTRTALQDVLREKQLHIEQLLKERNLERAEFTRAANQADNAEQQLATLQAEYEHYRAECESKLKEYSTVLSHLNVDRGTLLSQLEDEKRKNEDLQFKFEEAAITKGDIEVSNQSNIHRIKDLEERLTFEKQKVELLEQESSKLFEAEEELVKSRDEIDSLKSNIQHLTMKRDVTSNDNSVSSETSSLIMQQIETKTKIASSNSKQNDEITLEFVTSHSDLEKQLEESKKKSAEHLEICEKYQHEITTLRTELSQTKNALQEQSVSMNEKIKNNSELESSLRVELELLKSELVRKSTELQKKDDELKIKDDEIRGLKTLLETTEIDLKAKTIDVERYQSFKQESEASYNKEIDYLKKILKEKVVEKEEIEKASTIEITKQKSKLEDAFRTIAVHFEEIQKLKSDLAEAKVDIERNSLDVHERHTRQIAIKESELMAVAAELQQKNEEISKCSIVTTKLEDDICIKNGIIEKLKLELESFKKRSESEEQSMLNYTERISVLQLTIGDLQRKLASTEQVVLEVQEQKVRLENELENVIASSGDYSVELQKMNAAVLEKELMITTVRNEYLQKLQMQQNNEQQLQLQLQRIKEDSERLEYNMREKLRISQESEDMLRQRCESANGEAIKVRDDLMIKINQLQRMVEEKEFALKVSAGDHTENTRYLKEQLDRTTAELQKTINNCQYKINELSVENINSKNVLAQKTQELIESEAKLKHLMAQSQLNEEELHRLSEEQAKKLQFELSEKDAQVQQFLTELELLKRDCHSRNINIVEKDHHISELSVQLENTLKLVKQLQVEKDNLQLAQIEADKQCSVRNQQCTDLVNQVAILSEKAKLGDKVAQELQMQKGLHQQLIRHLEITETQKQNLVARLEEEAKKNGEAKNCYNMLELAKSIQTSTNNEHTRKIMELQQLIETTKLQLRDNQNQVETQKKEILSLQNELLSAQQLCGPNVNSSNTVSNTHGNKPTIHTQYPAFLQVQLTNLKNSYLELLQRFVGSQKLNVYLINKLELAVSNGDTRNIHSLLKELVNLKNYLNVLKGTVEQDKFKFQKIISYALLTLHRKQVEINVQNNYIKQLQNIYNSLPTQCKLLQSNTVKGLDSELPNEAQIELEKTIQLIRVKNEHIQNLKIQLISIQENCKRLFNTKCPITPALESQSINGNSQFVPTYCGPSRVMIKKVPVVQIVRQPCDQVYPEYVKNQPIVDQIPQRCGPSRTIVQRVPVYIPRIVVKEVPRYVNENFKCSVPQVIYKRVPVPLPPKMIIVNKPVKVEGGYVTRLKQQMQQLLNECAQYIAINKNRQFSRTNLVIPWMPAINSGEPKQIAILTQQIQNLMYQLRQCKIESSRWSLTSNPVIAPSRESNACAKSLNIIQNQEIEINKLKYTLLSCNRNLEGSYPNSGVPSNNQQSHIAYLLSVIENLKRSCSASNVITNHSISNEYLKCTNIVLQHKTLFTNIASITRDIHQLINTNNLPDMVKATLSKTKLDNFVIQINQEIFVPQTLLNLQYEGPHVECRKTIIQQINQLNILRSILRNSLPQLNSSNLSPRDYLNLLKVTINRVLSQMSFNTEWQLASNGIDNFATCSNTLMQQEVRINILKTVIQGMLNQLNNGKLSELAKINILKAQIQNLLLQLNNKDINFGPSSFPKIIVPLVDNTVPKGPTTFETAQLIKQIQNLIRQLNVCRVSKVIPNIRRYPGWDDGLKIKNVLPLEVPQPVAIQQENVYLKKKIRELIIQLNVLNRNCQSRFVDQNTNPIFGCKSKDIEILQLKNQINILTQQLNNININVNKPGNIVNTQQTEIIILKKQIQNLLMQLRFYKSYPRSASEMQWQSPWEITATPRTDSNEINALKYQISKLYEKLNYARLYLRCPSESRDFLNRQCPSTKVILQKVLVPQTPSLQQQNEIIILKNQIQNLLMQLRFYKSYPRLAPEIQQTSPWELTPRLCPESNEIIALKFQISKLYEKLNYARLYPRCPSESRDFLNQQCLSPKVLVPQTPSLQQQNEITILKNQIQNLLMQLRLRKLYPTSVPERQWSSPWTVTTPPSSDSSQVNILKLQINKLTHELNYAKLYPRCLPQSGDLFIKPTPPIFNSPPYVLIPPNSDNLINGNKVINQCPPPRVIIRKILVPVSGIPHVIPQPDPTNEKIEYLNQKIQYLLYQLNNRRCDITSTPGAPCIPKRIVVPLPVPIGGSFDPRQQNILNFLRSQIQHLVIELNNIRQQVIVKQEQCQPSVPTVNNEQVIYLKQQIQQLLIEINSLHNRPIRQRVILVPTPVSFQRNDEINYLRRQLLYLIQQLNSANRHPLIYKKQCVSPKLVISGIRSFQLENEILYLKKRVQNLLIELGNARLFQNRNFLNQVPPSLVIRNTAQVNILKNQVLYLLEQLNNIGVFPGTLNIPCRPTICVPQPSPPQIVIRTVPVSRPSHTRIFIQPVPVPQPSPPKILVRPVPVPQPSPPRIIVRPVPIPQLSSPRVIIKTVIVPQPSPPRIIVRPVPIRQPSPERLIIQQVPVPQSIPPRIIIKTVNVPVLTPPRIIVRPVPVPVLQPSPPRVIIKTVNVPQPSPLRIIIRPVPVPQSVPSPQLFPPRIMYVPQTSPTRIIIRPVPGPTRTIIKTVPVLRPSVPRTIIPPIPTQPCAPPKIIVRPVPRPSLEFNGEIIFLKQQIQNLLVQLNSRSSIMVKPGSSLTPSQQYEVNMLKVEIENVVRQIKNLQNKCFTRRQPEILVPAPINPVPSPDFLQPCPTPIIKYIPIIKQPNAIIKEVRVPISQNCKIPQVIEHNVPVPQPPKIMIKIVPVIQPPKIIIKKVLVPMESPCPPPEVVVQKVPVFQSPKTILKEVPILQPPKIIIKEVRVPQPPEIKIKYVPVPFTENVNCPTPKIIVQRIPVLQPPRTIVKEVPISRAPQILIKEVPVPQPPKVILKEIPVFHKDLCQQTSLPTTVIKEVPTPVPVQTTCNVPKYVIQQVPVVQPPKIIVKTIPITISPKEIIKTVHVPIVEGKTCPPPQIITQRIPVVQIKTVIKEVPISHPPRIIIKQVPVPQPPQIILKKIPILVGQNIQCPTPQVIIEKVEVPQPPRIIIKQLPVILPPRIVIQEVPKYVFVSSPAGRNQNINPDYDILSNIDRVFDKNIGITPIGCPQAIIKEIPIDTRRKCDVPKVIVHYVPINQPPKIIVKNLPVVLPPKIIIKKVPVGANVNCRTPQIILRPVPVIQPSRTVLKEVQIPQPPRIIIKEVSVIRPQVQVKYVPVPVVRNIECPRPQVIVQKVLVPQPPRTIVTEIPSQQPPRIFVKEVLVPRPPQIIIKEIPQLISGGASTSFIPISENARYVEEIRTLRLEVRDLSNKLKTCVRESFGENEDKNSFINNVYGGPVQSLPQCLNQLQKHKIIIYKLNYRLRNIVCNYPNNPVLNDQISGIWGGINKDLSDGSTTLPFIKNSPYEIPSLLGLPRIKLPSKQSRIENPFLQSSSLNLPLPMLNVLKSNPSSISNLKPKNGLQSLFMKVLHEAFTYTQTALTKCMSAVLIQQLATQTDNSDVGWKGDRQLMEEKQLAEGQIQFLNSIIVDMQRKSQEQQARIELLESGYSPSAAEELKLFGVPQVQGHQRPPRIYCDICELFDDHETEDCPLQASGIDVLDAPSTYTRRTRASPSNRSYCEICEIFGHCTEDCKEDQTF